MADLDYSAYNNLPYIRDADTLFNTQLASNNPPLSRETFLSKLFPLFKNDPDALNYGVCLTHRHYLLTEGERMVSEGLSTQPRTEVSDNIVPEVWLITGSAAEHRLVDASTLPAPLRPSPELFQKFSEISGAYNVDALGICNLPPGLAVQDGFVVVETAGELPREQVIRVVSVAEKRAIGDTFQAMWVPAETAMVCVCQCESHRPTQVVVPTA